jgi:hypothetical protein
MNLHLAEIATQIAPGAHAALLVDQAGWHLSGRLIVPPNITLIRRRQSNSIRRRVARHARSQATPYPARARHSVNAIERLCL